MKDMTVGSPFKHVIYFTIPLLLGNFAQQLYTLADTVIVGRTLGTSALGSIGAVVSLIFFIQGFAIGVGSGLSIVLAQRFGSKNEQRIHDSYVTSIGISFVFSVVISIVSI
uniref:MATE family efflux transporter n=1 Tax=Jeotgalibaca porci TaxID=1868793 RepID=UPI0035A09ADF